MNNSNPLVTIVIPLYNGAKYVSEAITSALNQTYSEIEIIVINDGSKDNCASRKVCEPFLDRIIYLEKNNGGVSSVLNLAFETMKGEFLSWLSHDDLYHPEKVSKQIELLKSLNNTDKQIVFSNFDFISSSGAKLKFVTKSNIFDGMTNKELIFYNIKRNSFGGCTFLIPKTAYYDIGGFDEQLRTISDFDYWYRLLFSGYTFHYLEETLVSNRMHPEQVTYLLSDLAHKEMKIFYSKVYYMMKNDSNYVVNDYYVLALLLIRRGIYDIGEFILSEIQVLSKSSIPLKVKLLVLYHKSYYLCKAFAKKIYIRVYVENNKA